jgi:hypothetical protein
MQRKGETLRSYIQRWSIIKNSAEDVFNEQAVDAFSADLRRSDLMEELGRARPKTVSELIEIASRFTDGEDTYNKKKGRVHQKWTEQAGKGAGLATRTTAQDTTK